MDEWAPGERLYLVCLGLVVNSFPKILRALIKERCKPDLQTYIASNHDKIKRIKTMSQYQKAVLGRNANIDEWDMTFLYWFLTQVTTVELPERKQLERLRAIRNELVHCSHMHLAPKQYEIIIADIKSAITYFGKLMDHDFDLDKDITHINTVIPVNKTTGGELFDEMSALLKSWHHSEAQVGIAAIIKSSDTTSEINLSDLPVGRATIIKPADSDPTITTDEPSTSAAVESRSSKTMPVLGKRIFENITLELIMNPMMIPCYLLEKGMTSKESTALIQWLLAAAEAEYSTADFVWIGYDITMYEEKIPTIVAMYKSFPKDLEFKSRFLSFEVIQKEIGDLSPEAQDVADYEREKKMQFSQEETKKLQDCLDSNTERLMNEHSNLLIICASKVKSTRYGLPDASLEQKACVVLYLHLKGIIPIGEEPFPAELDGFPVDVRESMFENYGRPDDYFENLIMGCKIQSEYTVYGTLGGFVRLESGELGCLTCCHIFKTPESQHCFPKKKDVKITKLKKNVYQPSMRTEAFGEVIQCIDCQNYKDKVGVDAALIKITETTRRPTSGRFPNADSPSCGFSAAKPMVFDSGDIINSWEEVPYTCRVVKYGATTEHTIGFLNPICISARGYECKQELDYKTPRKALHRQIEVWFVHNQPFAEPGDSGSLVFAVTGKQNQQRIRALGMLVGGTKHRTVMVTPIWAVLGLLRKQKLIKSSSSLFCFSPASRLSDSKDDSDEAAKSNNASTDALTNRIVAVESKMNKMDASINSIQDSNKGIHAKMDENQASIKSIHKQMEENHAALLSFLGTVATSANVPNENS